MRIKRNMQVMWMIKALLACYIVTGILLVLISFLFYKWNLEEQIVTAGIISTYAISTFVGGFIVGKIKGTRKLQWGMLLGIVYYLFLVAISYGVYRTVDSSRAELLTTLLLCAGGGMLGGWLS